MNQGSPSFRQILNAALNEAESSMLPSQEGGVTSSRERNFDTVPLNPLNIPIQFSPPPAMNYPKKPLGLRGESPRPPPPPAPPEPEVCMDSLSIEGAMHLRLLLGKATPTKGKITLSLIKRTYRLKAKELHPDCHPQAPVTKLKKLNEEFSHLKESYLKLSSEIKRLIESP